MKHVPDFYYTKPVNKYKPQMTSLDELEKLVPQEVVSPPTRGGEQLMSVPRSQAHGQALYNEEENFFKEHFTLVPS